MKRWLAVLLMLNGVPVLATTVDFDDPPVPDLQLGTFGELLLDQGAVPWCGEGPYDTDPTRNIYFCENVGSLPIRFINGLTSLERMEFFATSTATIDIYWGGQLIVDDAIISAGGTTVLDIDASGPSSDVITIQSSCGYCLGLTTIVYNEGVPPGPAQCSDGIDNDGDTLIDFPADLGCADPDDSDETDPAPSQCSDGVDNDGDTLIDFPADLGCADPDDNDETDLPPAAQGPDNEYSYAIRFNGGNVDGDVDRIKYRIDDPDTNVPGPAWDIGATDFTIEFWILPTDPAPPSVACSGYDWINGNIVYDRDVYGLGGHGFAHVTSGIVFGIDVAGSATSVCGGGDLYGAWHHVALQRTQATGELQLFVDGVMVDSAIGGSGDVSYPDGYYPGNYCNGPCVNSDPFIVVGAEKHDAEVTLYPPYQGLFDELRLSTVLRYPAPGFTPPSRHTWDDATVLLEQFDHRVNFGGSPNGPEYVR